MTNAPESRKTHITRVFGTNKNGDRLDDVWCDVERMDIIKSAHQVPPNLQWQGLQRTNRWCDDPSADDYNPDGTPSRILETLKVCDVESANDPSDPDEWVPIKVVKGLKARVETGTEEQAGSAMARFLASVTQQELQTAREVKVRRIVHYDTNYDDIIQAAADADGGLLEYVIPADSYEKDTSTKDKDQYVEHEIILHLKAGGNHGEVGQNSQTSLLNQYLIDESEDATGEIVGPDGYNPAWRLDPFQNIINVSWGGLAIEVQDESGVNLSTATPDTKKATISFWFRVPQASLDDAASEIAAWKAADNPSDRPPLCGVVPLVTLGASGKAELWDNEPFTTGTVPRACAMRCDCGTWVEGTTVGGLPACRDAFELTGLKPRLNGQFKPADPSYIGVDCSGDYPMLSVNLILALANKATFEGSFPLTTTDTFTGDFNNYGDPFSVCRGGQVNCGPTTVIPAPFPGAGLNCAARVSWTNEEIVCDDTTADVALGRRNETFRLLPQHRIGESVGGDAADDNYQGIRVVGDRWHHVIVSFDGSNACVTKGQLIGLSSEEIPDPRLSAGDRTTSAPRMFVAMDDVNYQGAALSAYYPAGYSDKNAVCSVNGYFVCNDVTHEGTLDLTFLDGVQYPCQGGLDSVTQHQKKPLYTLKPSALPLSVAKMGFPASSEFQDAIKHVELADFRMLIGKVVDTGIVDNRRVFITDEGKPAPLGDMKKVLGQDADILLRPAHAFKKGRNVGELADDPPTDGKNFGEKIKTYRPEPSLHGDQGK